MSNALRTALDYVSQDQTQRAVDLEAVDAADMWAPRRAYEAGRIGADINANNADIASLRNAGHMEEAAALAKQNAALQRRQALYAPDVARVEDIGNNKGYLRDGLSWFGSQVGGAAASMQDPIALSAAAQAVGAPLARMGGTAGLIGKGIQYAGPLGAYGLNQRQMTGEHYGRLLEDPAAMQRLGHQGAYQQSNLVGAVSGVAETLLPGMVGRALGGAALAKGGAGMLGRSTGAKALGGTLMEGGNELTQGEISRLGLGYANPNRDTSRDASDRWNEALGGMAGGAPISAAGAYADTAYGRANRVGEVVREKAGEVADLMSDGVGGAKDKVGEAYKDSGIKGVVDLGVEAGKSIWGNTKGSLKAVQDYLRDEHGKIDLVGATQRARADVERYRMSTEEADLLSDLPPPGLDEAGLRAWSDNNVAARTEYVTNKLADLEAQGVEEASPWLDAIQSGDPIAMGRAVDEASAFLLERNTAAQVRLKAAQSRGIIGEMIQKGAERATRAAKAVSGAAVFTGMNAAEGVRKGLDGGGRKLNAQGAGLSTLDYDAWRAWRDKKYPAPAVGRGSTQAIQRAAEGRRALQELRGEVRRPIDPAAVERSRERATLFGEMLAAEAKARSRKIFAARADEIDGVTDYTNYVRSLGYEISDIADMWAQRMGVGPKQTQRPVGRDAELAHGSMEIMDSMAEDLHGVLGDAAPDIVGRMAQSAEPAARPFFEYLQERVDDQVNIYAARAEHRAARAERRAARAATQDRLQDQMLALLPQEHQTALREDGGAGARNLVQTVRMISRGRVTLGKRREVERAIGVDTLDRMLEIYGGMPEEPYADLTPGPVVDDRADLTPGPVVDDRGQGVTTYSDALSLNDDGEPVFEGDSYDARMAEKSTRSNRAPKIYMFDAPGTTALHSTDAENIKRPHDPFESSERPTGDRAKAIEDDARRLGFVRGGSRDGEPLPSRVRPRLIEAANPDEAREKMKAKVDYLRQTLARDKAAHHVDVVSAKEVMDSLNYSREKRLAMYRDYMFQDARRMANSKENPDPEGAADAVWQAVTAHAMVVEGLRAKEAKTNTGHSTARRKVVVAHRRAVAELKNARKDLDGWVKAGGDPERLEAVVAEATARAEELASTLAATSVLAKGREEVRSAPPPNSDQALVAEAMERYFASRYMVQAERASGDRVTGSISAGELVDMAKSGAKARSNAGKSGRLEGMPNFVEGGLLNFAQPEDGQLLGRAADKTLTIPVERLVGWVRSTRQWEDDEYSKRNDRNADERFVDDLLEGIAAVVDSGLVEGMPWINGRDGKKQVFSDDSISWANKQGEEKQVSVSGAKLPNDLHLPTKTGRGANYNTEKRREHAVAEAARKNQRVAERLGMDPENPDDLKRAEGLRWERRVEVGRDKAWAEAQKDEPFTSDPTVSNLAEDGPENIHSAVVGAGKPRGEFSAPEGMTEAGKAKRQERLHAVAAATRNRRASEKVAIRPESSIVGRYAGKDEQGNAKASRSSEFVHTGPRDSGTGFTRYVTHETPPTNQQKNRDRNDVTPLDTSLFIEAEETEFTDQQLRGKGIDTPKFENRMSAQAKARERAEQVFVYDEDPLEHDDDGKPTHVPREPNFEKTLNNVRQRLRIAQEKGQEAGARGGIQYVWPLTHALSVESLSKLADSPEYDRFLMAHSAVAHLVATSDKLADRERVAMARAMAEGDGSTSTHFTGPDAAQRAKVWLDKAAGIYRAEMTKRREAKAAKTASKAASEVAAGAAPKSQPKPGGVKLTAKTPYAAKDQVKADQATKFIGRGSPDSSTAQYTKDFGDRANVGRYTAQDVVFISAEGVRAGRLEPDFAEIDRAIAAGATLLTDPTDSVAARRAHNVGERAVAAHLRARGYVESAPGQWAPGGRKFNRQGTRATSTATLTQDVARDLTEVRDIMRQLGFKAAPEKFANVAEKLLAHPDQHPDLFIRQSAEGLSHILMEGEGGKEIRDMLKGVWWEPLRRKVAARLITQGMPHGEALTHAYREITRMALARELEARTKAEKTFTGRVMQLAKDFVSRFREMTKTEQFEDLVRNRLNDVIKKSMGPIDLKEGYTRVTFQQAVDGDPQAAAVLAHMTKNKNIAITGSIVLAANGSMYRDAANMLHDLDFIVQGSKEAAEAHLRSAFPDAVQVYDFQIPGGAKTDSFAVPPPGAKVINVQREFGDKGRLRGYDIARDGRVVGEMRVVGQGESAREVKTGERGTLVDLFTGRVVTPSHTIKFEYGGKSHLVRAMGADHIFDTKLAMSRDKDLGDYRKFVPNVGRKFNQQGTGKYEGWKTGPTARQGSGIASDADIDAARDYVNRVLGKQIKTEFENITGYSGEFIEAENAIRISTLTNAGVLNVARHEALHAFFAKFIKNNPKAVKVLSSLTDDERVLRRLQALLKDEPAALEQLADGEERLAFIYQFAMAGQLKLPHTPGTTLMHKIRKFLRRVFQMVSDQERAVDLLYAFEHGKMSEPSAAARAVAAALNQGTWLRQGSRKIDGFTQMLAAVTLPASTILLNSASPTARKIGQTLYSNPGEEGSAKGGVGYINERNQQMRRYDNLFRKAIDTLDARQMNELIEAMQRETPTNEVRDPDVQQAKEQLHALFARFYRYLKDEKGLRLGYRGENYFPVVWDVDGLMGNPKAFKSMLLGKYSRNMQSMAAEWEKARQKMLAEASPETLAFMKERGISQEPITAETVADTLYDTLTRSNGVADAALTTPMREDGVLRPWMAASELRELDFIAPEDRAPFLEKDLVKTLSRYVRQGVHTAEYSARFGRGGKLLDDQLKDVRMELERASAEMLRMGDLKDEKAREKWVKRQYRDVANAVGGIEGSLGSNVSETVRKINSWAIVYQNVRLLPLALFSSFVDPLGIVARGGEMRDAWATFMDGMKGVARQWGDMLREEPAQRRKDQWEALAEHAGVIDGATFSHLLHDEYASVYLNGTTKKINETMFKANGMEAWNRAMRVGATRSAVRFMERHDQKPTQHSERWMRDLGFEPGTLPLDADGHLITDKRVMMSENPNMGEVEAEAQIAKVHYAINRWVEGAILSPNAAQRPAWGSDPHYSMFWHLKQFAYSFHETIMKRALSEAKHGNVMPLGVFAWYIPTMIAADVTKGLMLGGGELPAYMKSYDLGDWMLHGVDRAGVLGMGQVAIDVVQDPGGAAGPVIEQVIDSLTQPIEETIIEALPAHAFYKRALA